MKRISKYFNLGPKLRKLRKQLMLKQENVARLAKMDKSTLSRIECCRLKDIKEIHLKNLAKAYNMPLRQLLSLDLQEDASSAIVAASLDGEAIIAMLEEKVQLLETQCLALQQMVKNVSKENRMLKKSRKPRYAAAARFQRASSM